MGLQWGAYPMEAIFRKIIANDFSDLAGLTAGASVPVPEALLNEVIAAAIEGDQTIQSCQVTIHEQNRISVRLKVKVLPWTLHLKLKLDRSLDFASFSSPKIRMWLETHRLLSSMGSFFNAFPEWAKLYGNQVVVDIDALLRTPEEQKLFSLVRSVD